MPGLGSPIFGNRSSVTLSSSADRELALKNLTSHKDRSSPIGEKTASSERSDIFKQLRSPLPERSSSGSQPSLRGLSTLPSSRGPNNQQNRIPKDGRFSRSPNESPDDSKSGERKPSSYGLGLGLDERHMRSSSTRLKSPSTHHGRGESDEGRHSSADRPSGGLLATLTDKMEEEDRLKSQQKKKKKRKNPVSANLSGTRYDIIRMICDRLGFTMVKDEDPTAYLIWNDSFVSSERIAELKPYQRLNHFPGMGEICRKDCLARNMAKMAKNHPEEYNFVPKTWIFPSEYGTFQNYARELKKKKKNKVFIVKPSNGAMGNGITLYKNAEKIPQNDHFIVQEYLDKPFLVDGYKCDMRIYVFVTSCDPLRIFLYNDGLLRLSTEKYTHPTDANLDELYMHLTNYSVNKHNENYDKSGQTDTGSKRSLKFFNDYLRHHDFDVAYLWRNITDMIIKTLIVSHPHVLHAYRMCRPGQAPGSDSVSFEILGFDVMIDKKLRPWLLEINRSPSFGTDERLDYELKSGVIEDSLRLLNIRASDKRKNMAAQKAQAQKRLLRPTKRVESDELDKKRQSVEKKKEELKDMLARMKRDATREEFENRNCGRFKRIFPPDDKFRREKYTNLLSDAYGIFLSGRASTLQQEIKKTYNNLLREEDILDMLAQCEADEKDGKAITTNRPRGPKPLQSMPTLAREPDALDDEDMEDDDEDTEVAEQGHGQTWGSTKRPSSSGKSPAKGLKSKPLPGGNRQKPMESTESSLSLKEWEEDVTQRTLLALNDMRIKFPGRSDEEADYLLDKLHENWKFHKPRIASYWLVKLDSIKRRKVIDIVRSNVRAVLQRTWKTPDVDTLHLYRVVNRVFNRLLWSHGQGLWSCFQEQSSNSWETIFNKSTDAITESEMMCCRRIVQLCCDCLLIVYQFAADAKTAATQVTGQESHTEGLRRDSHYRSPSLNNLDKHPSIWNPTNSVMSRRFSRLYQSRSHSVNNLHIQS